MSIQKSTLYTLLFFIFIQVISALTSLSSVTDIQFLINDYSYFVFGVIELISIIIFFFLIKEQRKLIPKKTPILYCLLAIIIAVFYVYSQKWLNYFYDIFANTDFASQTTYSLSFELKKFNLNKFAIVILLPLSEELFFRSYIQNGLQKKYKPLISIGISSILFSLLHLPDAHNIFLAFFGGIISATFYFKFKSITPSIIFHISWNLLVSLT